ncbi:Coatomer subunit beta [Yarrowia sp. B02]|nr:Coatomer subunit beta [Yarrowia sp. B02]
MSDSAQYTLVYEPSTEKLSVRDFQNLLEKGRDDDKVDAMRQILVAMLNGDPMPQLLMQIIRFVMPSKNKQLKKLLHFYWEICPKLQPDGKLKQEMILVCNAIRNDLQHPNEYIRGETLRFLCKLKEPELLESLIPSVRSNLEHRHSYVRKNAVFAIASIREISEALVPDCDELISNFLDAETDATCKRNAFVSLANINRDWAFAYLQKQLPSIGSLDELIQLAFVQFIRRDAIVTPELKQSYIAIVLEMLEASSPAVTYEAAMALTALTSNPTALRAAAQELVDLAIHESDNNVKLIVLDRVDTLHRRNPGILNELSMSILLILSSADLDVRSKAIDIALDMVSSTNIDEVIKLFKKELQATVSQEYERNAEYRQVLIRAIHNCSIKFPQVAAQVADLLLDFVADFNSSSANDVIIFVREVVERFPNLRSTIVRRLLATLPSVRRATVYRSALWVIGEYCLDEADIQEAWQHIRNSLGEVPIVASERRKRDGETNGTIEEEPDVGETATHKPSRKVLADGTYATESALTTTVKAEVDEFEGQPLRSIILKDGNYFVAGVLGSTLAKLVFRYAAITKKPARVNALKAEAMLFLTSILRAGQSEFSAVSIDEDSTDRILSCIRAISQGDREPAVVEAYREDTKEAFRALVGKLDKVRADKKAADKRNNAVQVDDSLSFRQLVKTDGDDEEPEALDTIDTAVVSTKPLSSLAKVQPLTGFSDPIYAEAVINVHQFDIILDILLVNQTKETLRNLTVEFSVLGDLKVVDQPQSLNLGPHGFASLQTTIKVSSADASVIFGNIVYDGQSSLDNKVVILNDLHVDIMDYIKPSTCSETEFRSMWSEFEWENKVNLMAKGLTLQKYIRYFVENTNMKCLTPGAIKEDATDLEDDCGFLSANLYSISSFGEEALANISIEINDNLEISGHVRIRSKGQGLALSLGDRVADIQKQLVLKSMA